MDVIQDRRTCKRIVIKYPGSLHSIESLQGPLMGTTIDIGEGGLRFCVRRRPYHKRGDHVFIRIGTGGPESHLDFRGRITWLKPLLESNDQWEIGFEISRSDLVTRLWRSLVAAATTGLEE